MFRWAAFLEKSAQLSFGRRYHHGLAGLPLHHARSYRLPIAVSLLLSIAARHRIAPRRHFRRASRPCHCATADSFLPRYWWRLLCHNTLASLGVAHANIANGWLIAAAGFDDFAIIRLPTTIVLLPQIRLSIRFMRYLFYSRYDWTYIILNARITLNSIQYHKWVRAHALMAYWLGRYFRLKLATYSTKISHSPSLHILTRWWYDTLIIMPCAGFLLLFLSMHISDF